MSAGLHRSSSPERVTFCILTVSDSRDAGSDSSGDLIEEMLRKAGHEIRLRGLVRDEIEQIRGYIQRALEGGTDAIVITGGTGISSRDVTPEALDGLVERRLPGFGELFRVLSYQQIGSAAMMSRGLAGMVGKTVIFSLPGSPDAVELALKKLILPEIGHLIREARR